jgi:hypothetical protein
MEVLMIHQNVPAALAKATPTAKRLRSFFSSQRWMRAMRILVPSLITLSFPSIAHAQGTIDFSGANTLMNSFKTFAIYSGAVICFGGLIFAGIRMMSGRFQFTAPQRDLQVANRNLGTIQHIGIDGKISVRMGGTRDRIVRFDADQMRHFDHGYAVTSHSSQGLTSERVLVNMDTTVHQELINSRFAYVSVSRASHDAQIYTNDATSLARNLSRDVSKTSAIDFSEGQDRVATIGLERTGTSKTSTTAGLGLSL